MYLTRDDRALPMQEPDLESWFPKWQESPIPLVHKEDKQEVLQAVLTMVKNWSRQHFGSSITMQKTPTFFGMQLVLNSLPSGYHYENLKGDGIAKLLHAICWPHRIETINPVTPLGEYDARVAFLHHARRVPIYDPATFSHDEKDELELGRGGWYLCDVTVPRDWQHIGLVPSGVRSGNSHIYPARPKAEFQTWLNDYEIRLMRAHAWAYAIRKRVLFSPYNAPGGDPLRQWTEILSNAIERLEQQTDYAHNAKWQLMRHCLRAVALDTIGQFHHAGGKETLIKENGEYVIKQDAPLSEFSARWYHPEWAGAIWARARVAATRNALLMPKDAIVRINGDGIVVCKNVTIPDDTGKIGALRFKSPKGGIYA